MVIQDLIAKTCDEKNVEKENNIKKRCNTRTSQEATHPSTTQGQAHLIVVFLWDPVHQCQYDCTCEVLHDQYTYGFGIGLKFEHLAWPDGTRT